VSLQGCIKEVIQLVQSDIAERNVDLQLSIENNVPDQIAIDAQKLKQVILNLVLQNFYNLQDITVKINVSLKLLASEDDPDREDPFIMIEIENSKYVVKKKDVRRLERLDATRDF
jgi:ABC-type lipoprotein export system ATPase subunit